MNRGDLSSRLYVQGVQKIVAESQTVYDIVGEVINAHKIFAGDYEKIADLFQCRSIVSLCKKLFDFCKAEFRYVIESDRFQSTRSPGVMLRMRQGDCKHYAGFIAGILDCYRRRGKDFSWCYRFVSYELFDSSPKHVFVVAFIGGREYWIDPVLDSFDERDLIPVYKIDKKVFMPLYRMSGTFRNTTYSNSTNAKHSYGCQRMGQASTSDWTQLAKDVQKFVDDIAEGLPEGGLKNWLKSLNPAGGLKFWKELIFGKAFTTNDYRLGEYYMRAILGDSKIQYRGQVPDGIVPQAHAFFTSALGVRITSADHLDALAQGPQNYLAWMGPLADDITVPQAQRASDILRGLDYPQNQIDSRRNDVWDLQKFAAIPFIYPIPGVQPGIKYTGVSPITNEQLVNGFPESAKNGNGNGNGVPQKAGFGIAEFLQKNPILAIALVGGGIYFFTRKKRA